MRGHDQNHTEIWDPPLKKDSLHHLPEEALSFIPSCTGLYDGIIPPLRFPGYFSSFPQAECTSGSDHTVF